jgi:beta-galactosidase
VWTERLRLDGAEVVASYAEGVLAGVPALTRHAYGRGTAFYAATRLDDDAVARLTGQLLDHAGVPPAAEVSPGVEVVRRAAAAGSYLFVINHTDADASVAADGVELLTGAQVTGKLTVAAGDVAVVREAAVGG